jgi:hypothetical protein
MKLKPTCVQSQNYQKPMLLTQAHFDELTAVWKHETNFLSSINEMSNH